MGNYSEFDYGQLSIVGINGVRKNQDWGDLLVQYLMWQLRTIHEWPSAEKPATQRWSATLYSSCLGGSAHRRMDGGKGASVPDLTRKTS